MADLILRPTGRGGKFFLQLRDHGPAETSYLTLAMVSYETAREIAQARAPYWLVREPDPKAIQRERDLEKAEKLRAEAARLEAGADHG